MSNQPNASNENYKRRAPNYHKRQNPINEKERESDNLLNPCSWKPVYASHAEVSNGIDRCPARSKMPISTANPTGMKKIGSQPAPASAAPTPAAMGRNITDVKIMPSAWFIAIRLPQRSATGASLAVTFYLLLAQPAGTGGLGRLVSASAIA